MAGRRPRLSAVARLGLGRALAFKLRLALLAAGGVALLLALTVLAAIGVVADAGNQHVEGDSLVCERTEAGREAIPVELLALYERAAAAHGLGGRGVFVLAAINKVETDFGRNVSVSSAGAVGWMQFMPATWQRYGLDGNGDGRRDPADPADAIPAAAAYLRASGAPTDWYSAVFAYNHADWYVRRVRDLADGYQGTCALTAAPVSTGGGTLAWPTSVRTITGVFGEPRPGHRHAGIDIAAPHGAPVVASADGIVALVYETAQSGGYGNYVCLEHGPSLRTCSAHLSAVYVRAGQTVGQGQVIGAVGNTGHSFGAHLHFEVRVAPGWRPVDPVGYL
jgi:murein DD-endopeptidase MepM/ murein hydrolase activator NlpD